jgi:hypothetical protein
VKIKSKMDGTEVIRVEIEGDHGDYAAQLRALVGAMEHTDNRNDRITLGTILKAFLPNEQQMNLEK